VLLPGISLRYVQVQSVREDKGVVVVEGWGSRGHNAPSIVWARSLHCLWGLVGWWLRSPVRMSIELRSMIAASLLGHILFSAWVGGE